MNLSGHLFVLFSASFSHRLLHRHPFKCPPQLLPQGKQCSAEACQLFVQEKHSVFGHCSEVGPQREGKIAILVLPFSLPLSFYFVLCWSLLFWSSLLLSLLFSHKAWPDRSAYSFATEMDIFVGETWSELHCPTLHWDVVVMSTDSLVWLDLIANLWYWVDYKVSYQNKLVCPSTKSSCCSCVLIMKK